jgi:hypothetical protein
MILSRNIIMKEYFSKKFERAKLHFKDLHQKTVVRAWNLAKRLRPQQIRRDKKK